MGMADSRLYASDRFYDYGDCLDQLCQSCYGAVSGKRKGSRCEKSFGREQGTILVRQFMLESFILNFAASDRLSLRPRFCRLYLIP